MAFAGLLSGGVDHAPAPRTALSAYRAPSSVIDIYLTYLRDVRRLSPNTVESYARDLAALGTFADEGGKAVDTLTRRDLEAFVRSRMASGLAPRSVARMVACVRGFYRFVAVEQKRDVSPAEDLQAPRAWAALPKFLDWTRSTSCWPCRTRRRPAGCATRR